MTEDERRVKKWRYIQTHLPEMEAFLLEIKEMTHTIEEPLLFKDKNPVNHFTIEYIEKYDYKYE